jgi:hypothetical protein
MSGFLHDMSLEQKGALYEMHKIQWKGRMWGTDLSKPSESRDIIFCKFLRATSFNTNNAIKRLKKTLKWREQNDVENIADAPLPAMFQGYDHFLGIDKEGRPVLVSHFGDMNVEEVLKNVDLFVKYRVHVMERGIKRLLPFRRDHAEDLYQIHDYLDMPMSPFSRDPAVSEAMKQIAVVLGDHYPEFKGKSCFVNIPSFWAGLANTFAAAFMSERTRSKTRFLSSDLLPLLEDVEPQHLVEQVGGLADPLDPREWDERVQYEVVARKVDVHANSVEKIEVIDLDVDNELRMKMRLPIGDCIEIRSVDFVPFASGTSSTTAASAKKKSSSASKKKKACGDPKPIWTWRTKTKAKSGGTTESPVILVKFCSTEPGRIVLNVVNKSWFTTRPVIFAARRDGGCL